MSSPLDTAAALVTQMQMKHPELDGWDEIIAALRQAASPGTGSTSLTSTAQLDAQDFHAGPGRREFELCNSTSANWAAWHEA